MGAIGFTLLAHSIRVALDQLAMLALVLGPDRFALDRPLPALLLHRLLVGLRRRRVSAHHFKELDDRERERECNDPKNTILKSLGYCCMLHAFSLRTGHSDSRFFASNSGKS